MAPYQAFETQDGWINVGRSNQGLWEKLVVLLGASELAEDARFSDPNLRLANLVELNDILTTHFKSDSTENWIIRLEEAGIPSGPVLDIAEMSAHPKRWPVRWSKKSTRVCGLLDIP